MSVYIAARAPTNKSYYWPHHNIHVQLRCMVQKVTADYEISTSELMTQQRPCHQTEIVNGAHPGPV